MAKWSISKAFQWEMGHRVWSQRLDHEHLSLSTECACKHLHGHSYEIKVNLTSDTLDQSSMVTDFKNLNFVKKFLDEFLDHKFMIDVNDPNFSLITGVYFRPTAANFTPLGDVVDTTSVGPAVKLHRDSFVLVNFVPTSENICRYLYEFIEPIISDVAELSAVELWETKKSYCRYEG